MKKSLNKEITKYPIQRWVIVYNEKDTPNTMERCCTAFGQFYEDVIETFEKEKPHLNIIRVKLV